VVLIVVAGVVFASGRVGGSEFEGHWIRTDNPSWHFDIIRSGSGFSVTDEDGLTLRSSLQGNELRTEPFFGVTLILELAGDTLNAHFPTRTYEYRRAGADSTARAEAEAANVASGAAATTPPPTIQTPTTRTTAPTTSTQPEAGDISNPDELAECDDASAMEVDPGELQPGYNIAEFFVTAEPDCWSGWVRLPEGAERLWVWPQPEQAADVNLRRVSRHGRSADGGPGSQPVPPDGNLRTPGEDPPPIIHCAFRPRILA
jgi:hypothetical protein